MKRLALLLGFMTVALTTLSAQKGLLIETELVLTSGYEDGEQIEWSEPTDQMTTCILTNEWINITTHRGNVNFDVIKVEEIDEGTVFYINDYSFIMIVADRFDETKVDSVVFVEGDVIVKFKEVNNVVKL